MITRIIFHAELNDAIGENGGVSRILPRYNQTLASDLIDNGIG